MAASVRSVSRTEKRTNLRALESGWILLGRTFVLCADCLAHGNAIFYQAEEDDQITVTLDVSKCRYREAQAAILHGADPFHISEIVEQRHMDLLRKHPVIRGPFPTRDSHENKETGQA
jgi:hypothetical protein